MADKNRSKKEIIIVDSITAVISALAIETLYPPFLPIAILLKLASLFGVSFVVWTFSKYDKVFRNCGLIVGQAIPILKYKTKTNYSTIYHFTLPAGLSLTDFHDNEEAIQNYIGKDIRIDYTFKEIIIEEFDEKMKHFYKYEPQELKGYVPILIGYNRKGELISCDLGDGEPHMLIAGETGGGKSTILRCILTNLIIFTNVKLHLIDLKMGVEFRQFSYADNAISFSRNISQAKTVLNQIDIEVDRRYDIFYKENVKDIIEYNKKHKTNKLDYQLVVVDEFADLQGDKEINSILDNLGRKARACGIHMLLSTQRPDMKVLTGNIKANIPTILGLKTCNSNNSRIVIDDVGLEKLCGKGHGLFKRGGKIEEVQSPFVDTDEVNLLIANKCNKNKKPKNDANNKYNSVKTESFNDDESQPFFNKTFNNSQPKKNDIIDTTYIEVDSGIPNTGLNQDQFNDEDIPIFSCEVKPKKQTKTAKQPNPINNSSTEIAIRPSNSTTNTKSTNNTMSCSRVNSSATVSCICKCEKFNYHKGEIKNETEKISSKIKPCTTLSVKENDIIVNCTPHIKHNSVVTYTDNLKNNNESDRYISDKPTNISNNVGNKSSNTDSTNIKPKSNFVEVEYL